MPRMYEQSARGTDICMYVPNPDISNMVCGRPKRSHSIKAKYPITHPFGGPDGTLLELRMPTCGACGIDIDKGQRYRSWSPRNAPRHIRHLDCPPPPRSAMTGSEILAAAWDIADDDLGLELATLTREEWEEARDDLYERINSDVVELIQEKLDNIESGMGHTYAPVYEELDERRSMFEEWADDIQNLDSDSYNDGACEECGLGESDHALADEEHDFQGWDPESAIDALLDAQSSCPE